MLHTEGCPHAADYLPRLRRLVAGDGVGTPPDEWVLAMLPYLGSAAT